MQREIAHKIAIKKSDFALQVENLSLTIKQGRRHTALLREISFSLPQGARLAIIGPNGAGKSTLLKAILGLLPAEFTRCEIMGEALPELSSLARAQKMSYIAQMSEIAEWTTVYEWCEFSRYAAQKSGGASSHVTSPHLNLEQWMHVVPKSEEISALTREEAMIYWALNAVDAWHFRERELCSLSGGERQRVLFAGALAQETPLILLDEPSAAFDPKVKHTFHQWLTAFKEKTFLVVTHELNLIPQVYTHVLALKKGETCFFGAAETVMTPENLSYLFDTPFRAIKDPEEGGYLYLSELSSL